METDLSNDDKQLVREFLRQIDFENLRALWAGEPLDYRGNLSREQLEQVMHEYRWPSQISIPYYLVDNLEKYRTTEERLRHFSLLMSQFYRYQIDHHTGFISDYYAFQRDLRLVMLGFRAKMMGRDLAAELQYEDATDPIVAQILAQKDSKTFEPPFEYKELKPIFEQYGDQPLELNKALFEYQFNHIIELWGGEPFNIDRILNYLARLILVERWLEFDVQKGIQIVDRIEKEIA